MIGRKDPPPFAPDAIVICGASYMGDDGTGHMMRFPIKAGERRSSTDPAVLACPAMWYLDGHEATWQREQQERQERFFESHKQ